jgi:pilus assembly protein CpaC
MVQLIPVADKLIIRGQARDGKEAAEILSIIGEQTVDQTGRQLGPRSFVNLGTAARPYPGASDLPASDIINLLEVPGEQQVMLKVRIAELTRSALREVGAEFTIESGDFSFSSLLGVGGAFNAILDTEEVTLALQAISSNGYSKILAEPNLVTLNGQTASFIAGGEFAVPTAVGLGGIGVATTSFRGFGTQLTFTPTIIDKDRIRLFVAPSFSTTNSSNTVDGIPGLDSRAVTTTVVLREGQWLAIGGLLQDQQAGSKARVPLLGDIPIVGTIFSRKSIKREETELLILVSPELVHPLEGEEVPLILPGMEVTEPTNLDFFFLGRYEGRPNCDHRSTVWPIYRDHLHLAQRQAMREARNQIRYQDCEQHYIHGSHGFTD